MSYHRHGLSSKSRNRRRKLIVEKLEQRQLLAVVTGILFEDLNNNGTYEPANDAPLRNTQIQFRADGTSLASLRSDASGFFQFDDGLLNTPNLQISIGSNFRFVNVRDGNAFEFKRLNDILAGHVVLDRNLIDKREPHERILAGETVGLDVNGVGIIDRTTVTNDAGFFQFTGVAASLAEGIPDPNILVLQSGGLIDLSVNTILDKHTVAEISRPLTLNGAANPQIIFGDPVTEDCTDLLIQPFAFEDLNEDGIFNGNDVPIRNTRMLVGGVETNTRGNGIFDAGNITTPDLSDLLQIDGFRIVRNRDSARFDQYGFISTANFTDEIFVRLFQDLNKDGTFEPGTEPLQANYPVGIDIDGDGVIDRIEVSNLDGEVTFRNLRFSEPNVLYVAGQTVSTAISEIVVNDVSIGRSLSYQVDVSRHLSGVLLDATTPILRGIPEALIELLSEGVPVPSSPPNFVNPTFIQTPNGDYRFQTLASVQPYESQLLSATFNVVSRESDEITEIITKGNDFTAFSISPATFNGNDLINSGNDQDIVTLYSSVPVAGQPDSPFSFTEYFAFTESDQTPIPFGAHRVIFNRTDSASDIAQKLADAINALSSVRRPFNASVVGPGPLRTRTTLGINHPTHIIRLDNATIGIDREVLLAREQLSTISGQVYHDRDGNGARATGEQSLAGLTVSLLANGAVRSFTTDASGTYTFPDLRPGNYSLTVTPPTPNNPNQPLPSEWFRTTDLTPITLVRGQDQTLPPTGFYLFSRIEGTVYGDENLNGQREGSESIIQNWSVAISPQIDIPGRSASPEYTASGYAFRHLLHVGSSVRVPVDQRQMLGTSLLTGPTFHYEIVPDLKQGWEFPLLTPRINGAGTLVSGFVDQRDISSVNVASSANQFLLVGELGGSVATADVSEDGRLDLVTTGDFERTVPRRSQVAVFANGSQYSFGSAVRTGNENSRPQAVQVHPETNSVVYVAEVGDPFDPTSPQGIRKLEFAGNNFVDRGIIVDVVGNAPISALRNNDSVRSTTANPDRLDGPIDFAYDPQLGFVIASLRTDSIIIDKGDGSQRSYLQVGTDPLAIKVIDLNGDGFSDIIATHLDGYVDIFTQVPGTTTPIFDHQSIETKLGGPTGLDVGDLNLDGIPDIVVTNWTDNFGTRTEPNGNEVIDYANFTDSDRDVLVFLLGKDPSNAMTIPTPIALQLPADKAAVRVTIADVNSPLGAQPFPDILVTTDHICVPPPTDDHSEPCVTQDDDLYVFINDHGSFATQGASISYRLADGGELRQDPRQIAVENLDADPLNDFVVANRVGGLSVHRNNQPQVVDLRLGPAGYNPTDGTIETVSSIDFGFRNIGVNGQVIGTGTADANFADFQVEVTKPDGTSETLSLEQDGFFYLPLLDSTNTRRQGVHTFRLINSPTSTFPVAGLPQPVSLDLSQASLNFDPIKFEVNARLPPEGESFHNWALPMDVNNDGVVSPIDALMVVNRLNRGEPATGESATTSARRFAYHDVNGDGRTSPIDALEIINFFNRGGNGAPEAEANDESHDLAILAMIQDEELRKLRNRF